MWYFLVNPEGVKPITLRSSQESDLMHLKTEADKPFKLSMPPHKEWVALITYWWNEAFPDTSEGDANYERLANLMLPSVCYPLGHDQKKRTVGASKDATAGRSAVEKKRESESLNYDLIDPAMKRLVSQRIWIRPVHSIEETLPSMEEAFRATGTNFISAYTVLFGLFC